MKRGGDESCFGKWENVRLHSGQRYCALTQGLLQQHLPWIGAFSRTSPMTHSLSHPQDVRSPPCSYLNCVNLWLFSHYRYVLLNDNNRHNNLICLNKNNTNGKNNRHSTTGVTIATSSFCSGGSYWESWLNGPLVETIWKCGLFFFPGPSAQYGFNYKLLGGMPDWTRPAHIVFVMVA